MIIKVYSKIWRIFPETFLIRQVLNISLINENICLRDTVLRLNLPFDDDIVTQVMTENHLKKTVIGYFVYPNGDNLSVIVVRSNIFVA